MVLVAVLVVVVGLRVWTVPVYALTPGDATPVAALVTIKGLAVDSHHDTIMLTDVYLQSLNAWQWLFMHFQSHVEFVNADQLVEPGIPQSQLLAQGYLQMYDSKQSAQVAALRSLGWTVPATATGAVVNGVIASSPAQKAHLEVADRIVAANGTPVSTSCSLIAKVRSLSPGSTVRLRIERARISSRGVITYGAPVTTSLRTASAPSTLGPSGCGFHGRDRSWLGIGVENSVHYALPGSISINTTSIGGPSAGLAMTLTLIDQLSKGSLTGHYVVAATGTIDAQGHVGDVGGVAEKTVAVQRAGAQIFIVPTVEVPTAEANAQPGLRIIGVSTLAQALSDLHRLGGDVPRSLTTPR